MSDAHYLRFDKPADGSGLFDHTWGHDSVGQRIRITAIAVMIERPKLFKTRTATVEVTPIKKDFDDFLKVGGSNIEDSDIDVDFRTLHSGKIRDGCRCVPPIESICDQCPAHTHPQAPISINPTEALLFQLRLQLRKFDPNTPVYGIAAVIYDAVRRGPRIDMTTKT